MLHKKLKELYNVDNLSQEKGWNKILNTLEKMEENGELKDGIEIDFTDINVSNPWDSISFQQIVKKRNVYMVFTNNEETVNKIKLMHMLNGSNPDNVKNVKVILHKEKTQEEKRIDMYAKSLISTCVEKKRINGRDSAIFHLHKKYDQLYNTNTFNYVEAGINMLNSEDGIDYFIIDLGKLEPLRNVLQYIALIVTNFKKNGITIDVEIDDDNIETIKNYNLSMHQAANANYNSLDRYGILKRNLVENQAGLLLKYKSSRAVDDFGRHGKGEIISSRISIFKGFDTNKDGNVVAVFQSFYDSKFYTKQHWLVEHDNEIPSSLRYDEVEIELSCLGYGDIFLGSDYHFLRPIQASKSESRMVIYDIDNEGKNVKKIMTIPERMKAVFDNWGIEYNVESLEKDIEDTRNKLEDN